MEKNKYFLAFLTKIYMILMITISFLILPGCAPTMNLVNHDTGGALEKNASSTDKSGQNVKLSSIQVFYKLDPRLTKSLYMGERWVSPPNYDTVQEGDTFVVEAKAEALDANGQKVLVPIEWIPEEPDMVVVTSGENGLVTITVKGEGKCRLEVTSQGVSKIITISAALLKNAIRVQITR